MTGTYSAGVGNLETKFAILANTSVTDIVTATDGRSTIVNIHVANVDTSNAVHVTLEAYNGSTSYYITYQTDVAAMGSTDWQGPVLPKGWKLRATAETGNKLHLMVDYTLPQRKTATGQ